MIGMVGMIAAQANQGTFLKKEMGTMGRGFVGDKVINVYDKTGEDIQIDDTTAKAIMFNARKNLCADKDVSKLIAAGAVVEYIYILKNGVVVVDVDSCN